MNFKVSYFLSEISFLLIMKIRWVSNSNQELRIRILGTKGKNLLIRTIGGKLKMITLTIYNLKQLPRKLSVVEQVTSIKVGEGQLKQQTLAIANISKNLISIQVATTTKVLIKTLILNILNLFLIKHRDFKIKTSLLIKKN